MEQTACQFLRALRGRRSQVAFSRRLGYRSNIAARWEAGTRFPTATTTLLACQRLGSDVAPAFHRFHEPSAHRLVELSDASLADWLRSQRGDQPIADIAARSGLSRYQVSRCLSGETAASLPMFFQLVDAMTGRLPELVSLFVDIREIADLWPRYHAHETARLCAYQHPWSSAVLALIDVYSSSIHAASNIDSDRSIETVLPVTQMAARLGASIEEVTLSIRALQESRIIGIHQGRVRIVAPLLTDTRSDPDRAAKLRQHWSAVSHHRLQQPQPGDWFSHNVFAVSREDFARLRDLQTEFYQRARALIAESRPSEVAALMTLHLMSFDDQPS